MDQKSIAHTLATKTEVCNVGTKNITLKVVRYWNLRHQSISYAKNSTMSYANEGYGLLTSSRHQSISYAENSTMSYANEWYGLLTSALKALVSMTLMIIVNNSF